MRLYFILFCLCFGMVGFSQEVFEQPIWSNPILKAKTQIEMEQLQAVLKVVNTPPLSEKAHWRGGPSKFEDTLYIVSGDSLKFTVDTAGFLLDTLFLKKDAWQFGISKPVFTKKITYKTDRFHYVSRSGVTLGRDTVRIVFDYVKKSVPNDTINYLVIVKRANQITTMPKTYLNADKDTILCASTLGLTGKLTNSILGECALETIAKVKRKAYRYLDTCVYYRASRLGGLDNSTCLTLCDENEVCDNFIFPIFVTQDTLSIAESEKFMDDFSYAGPYPNAKLWLNDNVYVNNTYSLKPPSVGMATFDGLDYTGTPYGGGYGVSDVLTSAHLDMSSNYPKYLSFYAEPKGLGFAPDKNEVLALEFKTFDGKWTHIKDITVDYLYSVEESSPGFKQYAFPISDVKYLYKGFQFRLRAYGGRTGITDVWNIDYVRISVDNPQKDDKVLPFKDLAYTRIPKSLLKNYSAAPWKHIKGFEKQEISTNLEVDLYSHFGEVQNINNSDANIKEINTGTTLVQNYSYFPSDLLNVDNNVFISKINAMSPSQQDGLFDNLNKIPASAEDLTFVKTFSFDIAQEQDKSYAAVKQNDKVSTTTVCSNYFAYDDGTAESAIATLGTETQLQVRFRANVNDSLRAVLFHFPHYNRDITNMRFNLRVFVGNLGKTPTYEKLFLRPDYPDKYTEALQGFTQYKLTDEAGNLKPLFIPKGDFYVGWQQVTTGDEPFVVGYDKNTPQASGNNFKNTTGVWSNLVSSKGAVMIRPKLSSDIKKILATEAQENIAVEIFPNPANDYLTIRLADANVADFSYTIFDLSGKAIQQGNVLEVVDIQGIANGFYIIKIQNSKGNKAYRQKISIIK